MGCGNSHQYKIQDTIRNLEFESSVEISDLSLAKQPYFDLLNIFAKNNHCTSFVMRNVELTEKCDTLYELSKFIQKKTHISSLEIKSLNNLGNYAGKSLLSIMTELRDIHALKLIDVDFKNNDTKYISQAFEVENSLTHLVFNGSFFSGEAMETFLQGFQYLNTTKILNLEKLGIKDNNADILYNALTNVSELTDLNISNNALGSSVPLINKVLEANVQLLKLTLSNCYINDKSFSALQDVLSLNKTLFFLDLSINQITDISGDTLKCLLEENNSIKTIYLLQNKIRMISVKSKLPSAEIYRVVMEY